MVDSTSYPPRVQAKSPGRRWRSKGPWICSGAAGVERARGRFGNPSKPRRAGATAQCTPRYGRGGTLDAALFSSAPRDSGRRDSVTGGFDPDSRAGQPARTGGRSGGRPGSGAAVERAERDDRSGERLARFELPRTATPPPGGPMAVSFRRDGFFGSDRGRPAAGEYDWIYLLNSDAVPEPDALTAAGALREPGTFSIASQILLCDRTRFRDETNWTTLFLEAGIATVHDVIPQSDEPVEHFYSGGGARSFRRGFSAGSWTDAPIIRFIGRTSSGAGGRAS